MWGLLKRRKTRKPERRDHRRRSTREAYGPPLTAEEQNANLSKLERELNERMVCPAGKNQVYLRSLMTGGGTTPPRVALKCHLRKDAGMDPEVFYEHIRDVCCSDPEQCPAYQHFKDRYVQT